MGTEYVIAFQFLIGTVLRIKSWEVMYFLMMVSIPYRYGITSSLTTVGIGGDNMFQFLIGTVLQQYFRRFPALYSFFSL